MASFLPHKDKKFLLNEYSAQNLENSFLAQENNSSDPKSDASSFYPIMILDYTGAWNATLNPGSPSYFKLPKTQFDFFDENGGFAEFEATESGENVGITFYFYDGKYKDQKRAEVHIKINSFTKFDNNTSTFKHDLVQFTVDLYAGSSHSAKKNCYGSYRLSFIDDTTDLPYFPIHKDQKHISMNFTLSSSLCNISLSSKLSIYNPEIEEHMFYYAAMMTLVSLTHLYAVINMARTIFFDEVQGKRISIFTVGYFIGWDIFLCTFHFVDSLTTSTFFQFFITPGFSYFMLVTVFETRLILLVWRATYYRQYQTIDEVRRGISRFYTRFYGFLALFLLTCYFGLPKSWFLHIAGGFFIPQIIHNVIQKEKAKFDFDYVFLFGVTRIIPPIYLKSSASNIFKLTPDSSFMTTYLTIVFTQVLFLYAQSKLGSRFFIPPCFLPPKYNYYIRVNTDQSTDEVENCAICMDPLNRNPTTTKSELLEEKLPKYVTNMLTPCHHQFHDKCLKEWMDLKLECPFCRSALPPLD